MTIPDRAIVGLAGPNGAGKSTLLAASRGAPGTRAKGKSGCSAAIHARTPATLADVGYVGQDAPLYRSFTVGDTLEFARRTNARWDAELLERLPHTGCGSTNACRGAVRRQRVRLALAVALGKRPALLLLDEPFARLDPLAGREFLQLLMHGVTETDATVVIASHVIADIERVSDHIVLLSDGCVRLGGQGRGAAGLAPVAHRRRRPLGRIGGVREIVRERHSGRQMTLLARLERPGGRPVVVGGRDRPRGAAARLHGARAAAAAGPEETRRLRWHG